ncbi:MAG: PstS family phosphate ABC transporter substrate-binding protein [Planctomycetes bacterium]|nr:PstS family phosphate ABC transporter substrate-binding protein [Planctomycetota bacterium]
MAGRLGRGGRRNHGFCTKGAARKRHGQGRRLQHRLPDHRRRFRTGGGFKKFLDAKPDLRTDISDASRPIKPTELAKSKELGVDFIELPIAYDGIAVMVNPKNTWCDALTVAELKKIFESGSRIANWKDVRAGFPDAPLKIYAPSSDNGTYDYFVEAIIGGDAKTLRSDSVYSASATQTANVQGIAGDRGALGFFGFSYYENNRDRLKLLGIDNGDGKPLKPSLEAIRANAYHPLARPLFIYVNRKAADRPEVSAFATYLLKDASKIVEHPKVGYVALQPEIYAIALKRFEKRITGTVYSDEHVVHRPLADLFKAVD